MQFRILLTFLLTLGSLVGAGQQTASAGKKSALDKATLEAYVRHLVLYGPQVQVSVGDPQPSPLPGFVQVSIRASAGNASEERLFYISRDGQKIVQGNVFDINANPFQREIDMLKTDLQPSMGTPGAPVVIVVFSDFQCGYCREEGKMLRENALKDFPEQVRIYFKDFPLSQIHPWARQAAVAGRCVFRQNAALFWKYHDWIFARQGEVTPENLREKLAGFVSENKLDPLQFHACLDSKSANAEVDRSLAEGRELGVNSTPTLFVNGRRIAASIPWPNLKQIIELELGYQKTARNAGEKCCELKVPNPLNP